MVAVSRTAAPLNDHQVGNGQERHRASNHHPDPLGQASGDDRQTQTAGQPEQGKREP